MSNHLLMNIRPNNLPIVYNENYNISLYGFEKLHVFDTKKWGNVVRILKEKRLLKDCCLVKARKATLRDLAIVHTPRYLNSLRWSVKVAMIAEIPLLACVPNYFVQKSFLKPMRYHVGGTVMAGKLAVERGWAINIGGGFHHCSGTRGGGFCVFADISIMINMLLREKIIRSVMIIDLDAHQGNGYARDFRSMPSTVYILDMYNKNIYPKDQRAKKAITLKVELNNWVKDREYLIKLKKYLRVAFGEEGSPDLVVYNAGTDVLEGDPLGQLSLSAEGIVIRDELVFEMCKKKHVPIVMLTSGGYLKNTAQIIADSIHNLKNKGLIMGPNVRH